MMDAVQVNYVAVFMAGVVSMVVGFLWYSPFFFGKPWMKLMGLNAKDMKEAQKKMGPMYALSFAVTLVTAVVLYHVMTYSGAYNHYDKMMLALSTGFWVWVGFVAPVQVTEVIFGGKKWNLFFINTGYQLVSLVAMALVLAFV